MAAVTLKALAQRLAEGATSAVRLVRDALDRAEDPSGEGARVFVTLHRDRALASAAAADALRAAGLAPSPYAGIPISVKDLFDLAGEPTRAGSRVLADAPAALADAPAIARLRAAGFIVTGRTNMSEFAFSGLGLNPHFGTPASPFDRSARRIPGGSSSGAAVSVTDAMAFAGIGSDTGGSCRIPAAFCGIVGYKPTAASVPRAGTYPLSTSLDSVGPLANSVTCCRALHGLLSGTALPARPVGLKGLRLGVPQTIALDGLDGHVAALFARALTRLSQAGAVIRELPVLPFGDVASMNARGGFAAAESHAHHRALLTSRGEAYDPRVRLRILRGEEQSSADYLDLLSARQRFICAVADEIADVDALVLPTVPFAAPEIAPLEADDALFTRTNLLALRNPSFINMLDGCAISVPMHDEGEAPAGLMLAAAGGGDARLFDVAEAVEPLVASSIR